MKLVLFLAFSSVIYNVPTSATNSAKTRLTLGYLTGSHLSPDEHFYERPGQSISGAITLAVNEVNNDPHTLPEHVLEFVVMETRGRELESVRQTVRLVHENVSAIIGPQESCMYEARIGAAFNLPMISYFCTDIRLSDKSTYPTFARTVPQDSQISSALVEVLHTHGCDNVVFLYSDGRSALAATISQMLDSAGVRIADSRSFDGPVLLQDLDSFSDIIGPTYMKSDVYVFLGEVFEEYRLFLVELYALGHMEHTVFGVDTRRYDASDPQKYIEGFTLQRGGSVDLEPFRNYALLAPSAPVDPGYANFSALVNHYLEAPPFNFVNPFRDKGILKIIRPEASYLYDAVWLYARAAHQAIQAGQSPSDGHAIMEYIKGSSYTSVMGFDVQIDDHGDTQGNFTLLSLQDHPDGHGLYPAGYLNQAGPGALEMLYQNSSDSR